MCHPELHKAKNYSLARIGCIPASVIKAERMSIAERSPSPSLGTEGEAIRSFA